MYTIKRFEGKIVAVTGGAKGIGKGCCLRFAAEGARVAVLDLAMSEAAEVAAECERLSGQPALALSVQCRGRGQRRCGLCGDHRGVGRAAHPGRVRGHLHRPAAHRSAPEGLAAHH